MDGDMKKYLFLLLLIMSLSSHATKRHYTIMDLSNRLDNDVQVVFSKQWYDFDKDYKNPKNMPKKEVTRIKAKGGIEAGPGFAYVFKINDNLYLDVVYSLYNNNYATYTFCFSSKQRAYSSSKEEFKDKDAILKCESKENKDNKGKIVTLGDDNFKYFSLNYFFYQFEGDLHIKPVSWITGPFGIKAGIRDTGHVVNSKLKTGCSDSPKARLNMRILKKGMLRLNDGYYAMIDNCPYYSFCPKNSSYCEQKNSYFFTGDFYVLPIKSETETLFKNSANSIVHKLGTIIDYNIKPMNKLFKQKTNNNINVGDTVSGDKLYNLMKDTNDEYCKYSRQTNKNLICGEPKYTLQKRITGQLKYLPTKELKDYDCFVDSITYPNIGSNVCFLRNIKYGK